MDREIAKTYESIVPLAKDLKALRDWQKPLALAVNAEHRTLYGKNHGGLGLLQEAPEPSAGTIDLVNRPKLLKNKAANASSAPAADSTAQPTAADSTAHPPAADSTTQPPVTEGYISDADSSTG